MTKKKVTTINISEELLVLAKKEIPNLSGFIENCLSAYLGVGVNNFNINSMQEELDKLKQARLNLHLLTEVDYNTTVNEELNNKVDGSAWVKIWGTYRNNNNFNETDMLTACKKLLKTRQELINMMETLTDNCNRAEIVKLDNWEYALQRYQEIIK